MGDSVDEGGSVYIEPAVNWKWQVDGFYPRNPEAIKPDGRAIWTTGKVGDIFEEQYFYIPKDFGWLWEQFQGVKSLVSGIGLKITSVAGEKFTRNMKSISYKDKRSHEAVENKKLGSRVMTKRVTLGRTLYHRPDGSGKTWELNKGICTLKKSINKQDVYLFIGFIEVKRGEKGGDGKGYSYSIPTDGRGVLLIDHGVTC